MGILNGDKRFLPFHNSVEELLTAGINDNKWWMVVEQLQDLKTPKTLYYDNYYILYAVSK